VIIIGGTLNINTSSNKRDFCATPYETWTK